MIPDWLEESISEMKKSEQQKLKEIGEKEIIKFFLEMQIKIADPEWLKRVTAEKERSNKLSTHRYVEDLHARSKRLSEPINKSVELITSMVELKHPDLIYRATTGCV